MNGDGERLARHYFDLLNGRPIEEATQILAEGFVFHHPPLTPDEGWIGREVFLERALRLTRSAFPDMRFEIDDLLADDRRAAVRWTMHASHRGPYLGIPASGRVVRVSGCNFFRVEGGQIIVTWVVRDTLGLLQQIGGEVPG